MAENQGVSAFPLPPMQYAVIYTDENMKKGRTPHPPPPIQDNYTMFGAPFTADDAIIRPLEASGCKRLYPQNYDHKRELKKLNHSILVNFLDMLEILIRAPESPKRTEKLEDLNLLFINLHHLVNEFRPHQARETLRVMLEVQKNQRLEIADRFQQHLDKVKELIESALAKLPEDVNLDSKLLVESELMLENAGTLNDASDDGEQCDRLDSMMCDIVDGMS
ncbi:mediator of RNA polymerase II transcription subunit 7-like [Haliotis asinina]|uniref:mediator of RNA polymerase II transcription subunit 7-like n=1 Tax=Haliotis asinina TaxID=109174 RepID=UPI0035320B2B